MNRTSKTVLTSLLFISFIIVATPSSAQLFGTNKKKKQEVEEKKEEQKKEKDKLIEAVKGDRKIDGLFTLYQDTTSGSLKMVITRDQLDKPFIHFYYVENGVRESGTFKGQYRGSRILKISKYYDNLDFSIVNTSFYFDPNEPVSKAAAANMTDAIIYSTSIKATSKSDSAYLIDADNIFLTEALASAINRPSKPNPNAFNPGGLSKGKSRYHSVRNYPENLDVVVDYIYQNGNPKNHGSAAIADARSITIKVQHSLLEVPENNFEPRYDDPRVGYFTTKVTDLTSKSVTPYRDMIDRWHLEKKYPDSALSEPVEPITWWIENTTPLEIRPIIEKAALSWNVAFQKAGFKNAVAVKTQPDTATWDAGDIRYNVLRWTSSPSLGFGGYGPNFVNPLTGQVLGADIMLEYAVLASLARIDQVFDRQGLEASEGFEDFSCEAGSLAHIENVFGLAAIESLEDDSIARSQMVEDYIYYLILHEIGHTLGLNHNMKASQLHGIKDIHNSELTKEEGLLGSVMDYPSINLAKNRDQQGQYYATNPGPYDLWAIEYGYRPVADESELQTILKRSSEPELAFGNDADDMRSPGHGIDPTINIFDLTSDAVDYAVERIQLTNEVTSEILDKYKANKEGASFHELRWTYHAVNNQIAQSANIISRYIGGVYVNRAFVGQGDDSVKPLTPVESAKQKDAMKALSEYIFAPGAFAGEKELYNYLQLQRRGFNLNKSPEDPKLHGQFLSIQKNVLSHLLHANVLNRIVDTELYGNDYSLDKMMMELHKAIFSADAYGSVNSIRQNLQTEYVQRLIRIVDKKSSSYLPTVRSMAYYNLQQARAIASRASGDVSTKAHRAHLVYLIDEALEN